MTDYTGRTYACRNGDHWACQSRSGDWSTCACDCHAESGDTAND